VAAIVLAMVVVGGATRLTGSGLSITQWRPISGALPPLSASAWREDFDLYKATPQYRLVNRGMTLPRFKSIFWWEWTHRLLGRLAGAAFAIPFAVFLTARAVPRRLLGRCVLLLGLGGLQGLVGWWMVKSGLEGRISVAPERLATHLALAFVLLGALVWTALEAWSGPPIAARRDHWSVAGSILLTAVFVQCLLGALVAGNHGGLIDTDWPLMGGSVVPNDYWSGSLWRTIAHNPSAAQFDHRLAAYLVVILAAGVVLAAVRTKPLPSAIRSLAFIVGAIVMAQACLGVATVVAGAPLDLAIAHQAGAALLLIATTVFAWRTRRM
jgi:cytochrome c oxidase assembly protein subunit 15